MEWLKPITDRQFGNMNNDESAMRMYEDKIEGKGARPSMKHIKKVNYD